MALSGSPRLLLAALAAAGGCAFPAGLYPLDPLPVDDPGDENLSLSVRVALEHRPSEGWDLEMELKATPRAPAGGESVLLDLSRLMVRADQERWVPCQVPSDQDPKDLVRWVPAGETFATSVTCVAIPRPEGRLEVRFPTAGAGGNGLVELSFEGVKERSAGPP